jgi:hypothetical protein
VSPEQRAAKELFGFPQYVPSRPDQTYSLRDNSSEPRVSFNDLVRQYKAEDALQLRIVIAKAKSAFALMTPAQQQEAQLTQRKSWEASEKRDEAVALFERACK